MDRAGLNEASGLSKDKWVDRLLKSNRPDSDTSSYASIFPSNRNKQDQVQQARPLISNEALHRAHHRPRRVIRAGMHHRKSRVWPGRAWNPPTIKLPRGGLLQRSSVCVSGCSDLNHQSTPHTAQQQAFLAPASAGKPASSLLTRHATVVVGPASEIPQGERKVVDTDAGTARTHGHR